jgi:putative transposase
VLQQDGLHLFDIRYWSDELRGLMGQGEKVTVKYDPRDLSRIFVRVEFGYVEARHADVTRPAIALWEHRAAVAELRAAGRRAVDEDLIYSTILAQPRWSTWRARRARRPVVRSRGAPTSLRRQ